MKIYTGTKVSKKVSKKVKGGVNYFSATLYTEYAGIFLCSEDFYLNLIKPLHAQ